MRPFLRRAADGEAVTNGRRFVPTKLVSAWACVMITLGPPDPPCAGLAPIGNALTPYEHEHLVTYLRLLDADAEGADWKRSPASCCISTLRVSAVILAESFAPRPVVGPRRLNRQARYQVQTHPVICPWGATPFNDNACCCNLCFWMGGTLLLLCAGGHRGGVP